MRQGSKHPVTWALGLILHCSRRSFLGLSHLAFQVSIDEAPKILIDGRL